MSMRRSVQHKLEHNESFVPLVTLIYSTINDNFLETYEYSKEEYGLLNSLQLRDKQMLIQACEEFRQISFCVAVFGLFSTIHKDICKELDKLQKEKRECMKRVNRFMLLHDNVGDESSDDDECYLPNTDECMLDEMDNHQFFSFDKHALNEYASNLRLLNGLLDIFCDKGIIDEGTPNLKINIDHFCNFTKYCFKYDGRFIEPLRNWNKFKSLIDFMMFFEQ